MVVGFRVSCPFSGLQDTQHTEVSLLRYIICSPVTANYHLICAVHQSKRSLQRNMNLENNCRVMTCVRNLMRNNTDCRGVSCL